MQVLTLYCIILYNAAMNNITTTKFTIYIDADSIGIIQHLAKQEKRSISGQINYILKHYVQQYLEDLQNEKS